MRFSHHGNITVSLCHGVTLFILLLVVMVVVVVIVVVVTITPKWRKTEGCCGLTMQISQNVKTSYKL